jgi:hypothetical protein
VLPVLFELCDNNIQIDDSARLDVLWIATNIASGDSDLTNYVVSVNGLDFFLKHLSHASYSIVEQSFWGIGNIAGENA